MAVPSHMSASEQYEQYLSGAGELLLRSGGHVYPSINGAVSSLEWLAAQSFVVLGFDGLTIAGESLIASIEYIADFSDLMDEPDWSKRVQSSIEASRRVLERWTGKVQFVEMVVDGPSSPPGPAD